MTDKPTQTKSTYQNWGQSISSEKTQTGKTGPVVPANKADDQNKVPGKVYRNDFK